MTNPAAPQGRDGGLAQRIAAFAGKWSIEATSPRPDDVAALHAIMPAGGHVYLRAVATHPHARIVEAAAAVRRAGLEPVPHLAARTFSDAGALSDFLARATGEAGVRRLLVVAGDRDDAAGPFASALDVIDGGALQRAGISQIGIAGYPDGHPRIDGATLDEALRAKIVAAGRNGLSAHIVTQFCFDAAMILDWLRRLRATGITAPVRIGLVGPVSLRTLMNFARRCGVRASTRGLMRNAGALTSLFGESAPDAIIRALVESGDDLGLVTPHYFSFGGAVPTARWASAVAQGRIVLDGDGFSVRSS
jgi:methylenetetrahydrofolate reductase (NADPH)